MKTRRVIPRSVRFRVLAKANFRCTYCGDVGGPLVVDHVLPIALGGTNDEANLAASCTACNIGKGASNLVGSGGTFLGWLRLQRGREDWVGDLADDEERRPLQNEPATYKQLCQELRRRWRACRETLHAAWHAWRECRRGRMTNTTCQIHREARETIRRTLTDGGVFWTKRGFWAQGKFFPQA